MSAMRGCSKLRVSLCPANSGCALEDGAPGPAGERLIGHVVPLVQLLDQPEAVDGAAVAQVCKSVPLIHAVIAVICSSLANVST